MGQFPEFLNMHKPQKMLALWSSVRLCLRMKRSQSGCVEHPGLLWIPKKFRFPSGYDPYSTGASAWGSNGHTESTSSAWGAAGNKSYDTSPPIISVDHGDEVRYIVCFTVALYCRISLKTNTYKLAEDYGYHACMHLNGLRTPILRDMPPVPYTCATLIHEWTWQGNYARRAEQLDLKEKELRAKEAELRKMEEGLRSTGALRPEKNWPKCCPFVHHDIPGEVCILLVAATCDSPGQSACTVMCTGTVLRM